MDKKKLLGGILGIILGFVFSIPWILCYIHLEMIVTYLALIIGFGILWGYKLVNKQAYRNNKLIAYLFITSVLVIIIDTLIVIPVALLLREDLNVSIDLIKYVYSNDEFFAGIIGDLIISILFTIIGVLPVINKLQIEGKGEAIPISYEEFKNKVKEIFTRHDALEKEQAIDKEIIEKELEELNYKNSFYYFDKMKSSFLIGSNGTKKWYYNEKNESKSKVAIKWFIMLVIVFLVSAGVTWLVLDKTENNEDSYPKQEINYNISKYNTQELAEGVTIDIPDYMFFYNSEYDEGSSTEYYIYLPKSVKNGIFNSIEIYYYYDYVIGEDEIELFKSYLENNFETESYNIIESKTMDINNRKVVHIKIDEMLENCITNSYFVIGEEQVVELYFTSIENIQQEKFDSITNDIIKTIKL